MAEPNNRTHRKAVATAILVALLATATVAAIAPGATAATCSASDGKRTVEGSGSGSCSADCNPIGCNVQAHDQQAP